MYKFHDKFHSNSKKINKYMNKIILFTCIAILSSSALAIDLPRKSVDDQSEMLNSNAPILSSVDMPDVKLAKPTLPSNSNLNTEVKLEGLFHFQSAYRKQSGLVVEEKNVSANRKNFAFYTEAALAGTVARTMDEITYGGKIVIVPTTKPKTSPGYNGSHLFMQTEFGKVEAGSPYDAGSKLRVTGSDVIAGTEDWNRYAKFDGANVQYSQGKDFVPQTPEFTPYVDYFFDSTFKTELKQINDGTEPPRLVSFYTPKNNGLQAGISFIPDSSNTGGGNHNEDTTKDKGLKTFQVGKTLDTDPTLTDHRFIVYKNIKNAVAGGLTYEHNISDGVDLKLAATGEYGRISKKAKEVKTDDQGKVLSTNYYKVSDLKTYNLGAILNCGNMSYGASYGSLGKSFTFKEYYKAGRDTRYYNGAIAYTQGPIKASISYLKSERFKNNIDAFTFGTDLKIIPGLKPYAEVTYFQGKGRPVYTIEAPKKKV